MDVCATIRMANTIVVNGTALKENGMNLQLFVDCPQPGDTIIFDAAVIKPRNTTFVKHPVVFDIANPDTSRVVLKCPSGETIFDVQ